MSLESKKFASSIDSFVTEKPENSAVNTSSEKFIVNEEVKESAEEQCSSFYFKQGPKMNIDQIQLQFKTSDDWNVHFIKNSIDDDARKISFLISTIGQDGYQILKDVCEPVPPHNKTYDELRELIIRKQEVRVSIEKLPEECLLEIFEFLPIADRFRIKRVSRKFKEAATRQSWNKIKELSIDSKFLGLKPYGITHKYAKINYFNLQEILKKCGKYLTKVDLSFYKKCLLSLVAEYCPNIKSIKCCKPTITGIRKLTENCRNIVEISIHRMNY